MKCTACNREYTKKDLLYTEDKQLVCVNPFTCSEDHPNSPKNIVARGGAVKLFNEVELEENEFDKLEVSDELKKRINTVATKPQSIRLSKLPIAHYIVSKMEENENLNSISEVVRHCIEIAMRVEPLQGEQHTFANPSLAQEMKKIHEPIEVKPIEPITGGLTGIVVPSMPDFIPVTVPDDDEDEF